MLMFYLSKSRIFENLAPDKNKIPNENTMFSWSGILTLSLLTLPDIKKVGYPTAY